MSCSRPRLSFVASANCALFLGARPMFSDVDSDDRQPRPAACAERPACPSRAKACVAVSMAGLPIDLEPLQAARSQGLWSSRTPVTRSGRGARAARWVETQSPI